MFSNGQRRRSEPIASVRAYSRPHKANDPTAGHQSPILQQQAAAGAVRAPSAVKKRVKVGERNETIDPLWSVSQRLHCIGEADDKSIAIRHFHPRQCLRVQSFGSFSLVERTHPPSFSLNNQLNAMPFGGAPGETVPNKIFRRRPFPTFSVSLTGPRARRRALRIAQRFGDPVTPAHAILRYIEIQHLMASFALTRYPPVTGAAPAGAISRCFTSAGHAI